MNITSTGLGDQSTYAFDLFTSINEESNKNTPIKNFEKELEQYISIFGLNGVCSSGKTYGAIMDIIEQANKQIEDQKADQDYKLNFIISGISCELANQIYQQLTNPSQEQINAGQALPKHLRQYVKLITSDNLTEGNVTDNIIKCLIGGDKYDFNVHIFAQEGLFLTLESDINNIINRKSYKLFVDEIPQVDKFVSMNLSHEQRILIEHVELVRDEHNMPVKLFDNVYKVQLKNRSDTKKFVKKYHKNLDDVMKVFVDLFQNMLCSRYDTFVQSSEWDKIIIDKKPSVVTSTKDTSNTLRFMSMLNPSLFIGWDECTIMGANFTSSMLNHWFKEYHNVDIKLRSDIKLRVTDHVDISQYMVFHPLSDRWDYSKYHRDEPIEENSKKTFYDVYNELALEIATEIQSDDPDCKSICVVNNDKKETPPKGFERISVVCHGQNQYQDYRIIYVAVALNRQKIHINMLNTMGMSHDFIRICTAYEIIYQCIMRTALRNISNKKPVHVILPDIGTIYYLASLFPNASVMIKGNKMKISDWIKTLKHVQTKTATTKEGIRREYKQNRNAALTEEQFLAAKETRRQYNTTKKPEQTEEQKQAARAARKSYNQKKYLESKNTNSIKE
jgi:hypothetical protein